MPHDGLLPGPAILLPLVRSFSAAGRGLDALLGACPFPLSERFLSSLIRALLLSDDLNIARSILSAATGLDQPLHARHFSGLLRALCDRDGIRSAMLRSSEASVEIRADLMDAFKRTVLQDILDQKDKFQSIRQDILPYLIRSQLV